MAADEEAVSQEGVDSNTPSVIGQALSYEGITHDDTIAAENVLVECLSKIEVTDERFLRATPAHRVIECCGRVFRAETLPNFAPSRKVKRIDKFISHSWQASPVLKLLTVQRFYNWKVAVVAGNVAALLGLILSSLGLLPGTTKTPRWGSESIVQGTWSFAFGLLSFFLVWFSWSPREMVFLDRLCINQIDDEEKTRGVINIGGCLKHSKNLLVILDDTYCGRLWCMFELAAFLKTHEDGAILIQPVSLTLFLAVRLLQTSVMNFCNLLLSWDQILTLPISIAGTCFYGWFIAMVIARHTRGIALLKSQLERFTFEESSCFCCSVNHVNPQTNVPVLCDRAIIRKCVQKWFDSVEKFEQLVQTRVRDALSLHCGGSFCPYPLLIVSELPFWWCLVDMAAARFRQQDISSGIGFLALGSSMFVMSPLVLGVTIISVRDWVHRCPEMLRNLPSVVAAVAAVSMQLVVQGILLLCITSFGLLLGVVILNSLLLVPSVLVWRFANRQ